MKYHHTSRLVLLLEHVRNSPFGYSQGPPFGLLLPNKALLIVILHLHSYGYSHSERLDQNSIRLRSLQKRIPNMLLSIYLLVLVAGCGSDPRVPDVSDQVVEYEWIRFDRALLSLSTQEEVAALYAEYPAFTPLFFHQVLGLPASIGGQVSIGEINTMLAAETFTNLKRATEGYYGDDEDIKASWTQAMRYYQHHFDRQAPDVYCTLSEFGIAVFLFEDEDGEDALGLSLDMFLGDSIEYRRMARKDPIFSRYLSRSFDRLHLTTHALLPLIEDQMPEVRSRRFLDHFIAEGKKQYALSQLQPHTPDSILWRISEEQMDWLIDNEYNLYSYLVTEEMFYSDDVGRFMKLLNPAPTTSGLPPESPGRSLVYTAYQIVRAYMRKHPDTPLRTLLGEVDAETIFNEAKYRPSPR